MNLFKINSKTTSYLLPFIGGALYPLGFPMKVIPHFIGASFIGLILFFQALPLDLGKSTTPLPLKRILLSVLCFSIGYCLFGYYWIPYTFEEFGNIPFPLSTIIASLFSLIIVPQYIFFVLILFIYSKLRARPISLTSRVSTRNITFSILLVLLENFIPQQFPAHIGHTWLQLAPYLGLSPYFGVPLYSFFSYWLILTIVSWCKEEGGDRLALICFFLFLGLNIVLPLQYSTINSQRTSNLRLVQANIGNSAKVKSEQGDLGSTEVIYERYKRLSIVKPTQFEKIDLILWPETAYPRLLNTALMKVSPHSIPTTIRDVVESAGAPLFFGGYDKSGNTNMNFYETEFNSAFHISKEATLKEVYHKRLLIPFGESLPFGFLNASIAPFIRNISFFARGDRFPVFYLENKQRFISVICYEILFSSFIRNYLNAVDDHPDFLVNLTNDSWYGETSEPYQHQFLSHWRSLEFQIPMVRMTNTGVTSILYPDGSESKRLEVFKVGTLDIQLHLNKS